MNENDERKGLPSASGADKWWNCAHSHLGEQEYDNPSTPEAERGTMLHDVMAFPTNEKIEALNEDDRRAIGIADELQRNIMEQWSPGGMEPGTECVSEIRLWRGDFGRSYYSGKSDLLYIQGNRALLIDYKFGRAGIEEALNNKQMRVYATLAWANRSDIDDVRVATIQPWGSPQVTQADYDYETLRVSSMQAREKSMRAMIPDAPKCAGPWCGNCRKKIDCEAATGYALTLSSTTELTTPKEKGEFLGKVKTAISILQGYEKKIKADLVKDPDSVEGYEMRESKPSVSIKNARLAAKILAECGISHGDFADACTVSIPALVVPFQQAKEIKSQKAARLLLETAIKETLDYGPPTRKLYKTT